MRHAKILLAILLSSCGTEDSELKTVEFTIGGEYAMFTEAGNVSCDTGYTAETNESVATVQISADNGELTMISETGFVFDGRYRADNTFVLNATDYVDGITSTFTLTGTFEPEFWSGDIDVIMSGDGVTCGYSVRFSGERIQ